MIGPNTTANPYVGLRPFDRNDSLYFFGRREQTAEMLERLYQTHFLAVVGSSGCGKSSLIRAGLIPALLGGFLVEERDQWRIAVMKPGDGPLRNLAAALCRTDEHNPDEAEIKSLREAIIENHTEAVVDYVTPQLGRDTNLLLLVDQFEEIFSFRGQEEEEQLAQMSRKRRQQRARRRAEAADFADIVIELSERVDLPVYTVLTMRTDFLGDCDLFYGLPEAMNRSRYLVPRLTRQQLRQAIEGPALLSRAPIMPRLLDTLLNDLGDRADRLPVLQHALRRTWDFWHQNGGDGLIDLDHYNDAGTLENALSNHLEEVLRGLDEDVTARIFKRLTDTDPEQRQIRKPARLKELVSVSGASREEVETIVEQFSTKDDRNFLMTSGEADNPQVNISHESLIRQWDRLKRWVNQERETRDQYLELVDRAHKKRARLRSSDLDAALRWNKKATQDWASRYSKTESDYEDAKQYLIRSRQIRYGWRFGLWSAAAIVLILVGIVLLQTVGKAEAETRLAEAEIKADSLVTVADLLVTEALRESELASAALDEARVAVNEAETKQSLAEIREEQTIKALEEVENEFRALGQRLDQAEKEKAGFASRLDTLQARFTKRAASGQTFDSAYIAEQTTYLSLTKVDHFKQLLKDAALHKYPADNTVLRQRHADYARSLIARLRERADDISAAYVTEGSYPSISQSAEQTSIEQILTAVHWVEVYMNLRQTRHENGQTVVLLNGPGRLLLNNALYLFYVEMKDYYAALDRGVIDVPEEITLPDTPLNVPEEVALPDNGEVEDVVNVGAGIVPLVLYPRDASGINKCATCKLNCNFLKGTAQSLCIRSCKRVAC